MTGKSDFPRSIDLNSCDKINYIHVKLHKYLVEMKVLKMQSNIDEIVLLKMKNCKH